MFYRSSKSDTQSQANKRHLMLDRQYSQSLGPPRTEGRASGAESWDLGATMRFESIAVRSSNANQDPGARNVLNFTSDEGPQMRTISGKRAERTRIV